MIQDILLPEKIGSYHLFGKRVVGIEITGTHVYATVVFSGGSQTTIEQCLEANIEQHNGDSATVRTGTALKKILTLAGKYHEIRFAASSTHIIFKTMQLPFDDIEKIRKVIDFEVEPLLPFSIADAVIDFIVTKSNAELHTAEVLIAAVPKQYITQQLELFNQINVTPDVISIDLFELYGFYAQIYHDTAGNVALIEINSDNTKILFIADGQLRFLRTLPLQLDFTKKPTEELNRFSQPAADQEEQANRIIEPFDHAKSCAEGIRFTLQSFTTQAHVSTEAPTLYLLGAGANIPGVLPWLQDTLRMPCSLFNPTRIQEVPHIQLKNMTHIPNVNTISTAAAVTGPITEHVNIRKKEFAPNTERLLLKQLICGFVLLSGIFAALLTHSFLQKRTLRNELQASRDETAAMLQQSFPTIEKGSIDAMLEDAEEENAKDEQTWFAFKRSARNSLLNLLLELTRLNREGLGLIIDKIYIDQDRNMVTLVAQVKNHEALARLENELKQSNLFAHVPPQNDLNFTMDLPLKTDRERTT